MKFLKAIFERKYQAANFVLAWVSDNSRAANLRPEQQLELGTRRAKGPEQQLQVNTWHQGKRQALEEEKTGVAERR